MESGKTTNGTTSPVRKISAVKNWAMLKRKTSEKQRLIRGKLLCIIVGAGSGFGRAVSSVVFQDGGILPDAMADSKVLLIDKNPEDLREAVSKKLRQLLKNKKMDVDTLTVDLSDATETKRMLDDIKEKYNKDFEQILFINNAINLEDTSKLLIEYDDPFYLQKAWNFSITARAYVTTQICQIFCHSKRTTVLIANTDLSQAGPYLGLNAMASSALKTFADVFAQENPSIRVVHYVPRRMDTKKTKILKDECKKDDLQESLTQFYSKTKTHTATDSAKEFIEFLSDTSIEYTAGQLYCFSSENNDL